MFMLPFTSMHYAAYTIPVCFINPTRLPESVEQPARYQKAQWFPNQRYIQGEPKLYCISMDTILFLETILHFYSYPREVLPLHTEMVS
jgi:hypothetical protein